MLFLLSFGWASPSPNYSLGRQPSYMNKIVEPRDSLAKKICVPNIIILLISYQSRNNSFCFLFFFVRNLNKIQIKTTQIIDCIDFKSIKSRFTRSQNDIDNLSTEMGKKIVYL